MAVIDRIQGPGARPVNTPANRKSDAAGATAAAETKPQPHLEPPRAPQPAAVRQELDEALERLGSALSKVRPEPYTVGFETDEASGRTIIQIKNRNGEVIKQFPPEKLLNLHRRMDDLVGMIVDEAT